MKKITTLFLCLLIPFSIFSQVSDHVILHFKSGKSDLLKEHSASLDSFINTVNSGTGFEYRVIVGAHSDSIGKERLNKTLSVNRGENTVKYLIEHGIPDSLIDLTNYGETQPLSQSASKLNFDQNRRVDISILILKKDPPLLPISIKNLYDQSEVPTQVFKINTTKDATVRCKGGTIIYIKAKSFAYKGKAFKGKMVNLKIQEILKPSDAILQNLTTTSNGRILETGGMVNIKAQWGKRQLELLPGKELTVMIPKEGKILSNAQIFKGQRTPHDSSMNWTASNNSVLNSFDYADLQYCGGSMCLSGGFGPPLCPFFFCKIRNFSRNVFRKTQPQSTPSNFNLPDSLIPRCGEIAELFEKYKVDNLPDLMDAVNAPLYKKHKVNNMRDLRIALEKAKQKAIEKGYTAGKVSFEDVKYYVFNTPNLTWENVDEFSNLSGFRLTTLRVNLKSTPNTDIKLVFKNRSVILPPNQNGQYYYFKDVPKGEDVWIVAMKYDKGRSLLSLQEAQIGDGPFEVDFKELTLSELKAEIKRIDPLRQ